MHHYFDKLYVLLACLATYFACNFIPLPPYFWHLNVGTMLLYGYDKCASEMLKKYRARNIVLLALGAFGGWIGAIFGQQLFRHKTRKLSYQLPFIATIVFHVIFVLESNPYIWALRFINNNFFHCNQNLFSNIIFLN